MAPNVLTGLPLSLSTLVQATKPKDSYPDIVAWAEAKHRVVDGDKISLIELQPVQKAVLRYMFQRGPDGHLKFRTMVYSTIKKAGKALALNTALATPDGWTTMGDIQVGDSLFDEGGNICRVTYKTEPMLGHRCFQVFFSDSSFIIADADHQWEVESLPLHRKTVQTTEQLAQSLYRKGDRARNHRIRVAAPLKLPDVDLPINPYVLGVWLGDGTTKGSSITSADPEIMERVAEFEPVKMRVYGSSTPTYAVGPGPTWFNSEKRKNSFFTRLKELGVLGFKHIPAQYLRASFTQRLALLQGLMDTDGTISKSRNNGVSGRECTFAVTDMALAATFRELAHTLGLQTRMTVNIARLYGKDCGPNYRIKFHAPSDLPVFHLKRKLERQRPADSYQMRVMRSRNRHITDIREMNSVPVACIQVDSPSHLYLAGESMIPTHNTEVGGIVIRYAAEEMDKYGENYCVANDRDQAMERTYSAVRRSYELTPGYDRKNRILPGIARVTDVEAKVLSNNSVIRTVSLDAKGEAGANPVCSVWSEVWGFDNKPAMLLWDELTPALTRKNSFRFVESYAGIDPDSELLLRLYNQGVNDGRQVDAGELWAISGEELDVFAECHTIDDLVPIWVNEEAALVVYWDTGPRARRMPWQIGDRAEAYYRTEAESLTPESFKRVHLNEWVGATSAFVDASWWAACANPHIPPLKSGSSVPELVIAADGAVSGDCTALVAVSRHPTAPNEVVVRYCKAWTPPVGGKLDYSLTIKPELARLCREYNVLTVVYDPYQLHDLMTEMRKEGFSRFLEFNQGKQRMEADKGLYDLIKGRRIHYNPDPAMGGGCVDAACT